MVYDAKNKIAIVTGSAKGFGKEFVVRLLKHGARVCVTDVDEDEGEDTAKILKQQYGSQNVTFHRCNVADESDWMNTWSYTEKYFNGKVQILVNNAGVNPHHGWKTCLDVMIYGVMMGSYIARDKMGKTKGGSGGRVINIASMAGLFSGLTTFDGLGYGVSKWGAISFTRSYARCSAPKPWEDDGIKAYALCPWFANTDLLKESTNIKELEKDTMFRVLTVKDVGNAFEEALIADKNGGVYVVFPDIPIIDYPELNTNFILPVITFAKFVKPCFPKLKRINGISIIFVFLTTAFFISYIFVSSIL